MKGTDGSEYITNEIWRGEGRKRGWEGVGSEYTQESMEGGRVKFNFKLVLKSNLKLLSSSHKMRRRRRRRDSLGQGGGGMVEGGECQMAG